MAEKKLAEVLLRGFTRRQIEPGTIVPLCTGHLMSDQRVTAADERGTYYTRNDRPHEAYCGWCARGISEKWWGKDGPPFARTPGT